MAGTEIKSGNLDHASLGFLTFLQRHFNGKLRDEGDAEDLFIATSGACHQVGERRVSHLPTFSCYGRQLISVVLNSWNRLAQGFVLTRF